MSLKKKHDREVEFTWFFWHRCNYRCSYCFYNGEWKSLDTYFENISLEKLLNTWRKIYQKYGNAKILLAGGEPTIYSDFFTFIKKITLYHRISFCTNLYWHVDKIKEFIQMLEPGQVEITCSYHPEYVKLDDFLKKVVLLKNSGFLAHQEAVFVGWPPLLKKAAEIKKEFDKSHINVRLQPFHGEYEDKNYPESYSDGDRRIISSIVNEQSDESKKFASYQLGNKSPKRKLCRAGQIRAEIAGNGMVYRCGQCKDNPLGKFLDADFELLDEPLPCEGEHCICDFVYLVEQE